MKKSLGKLMGGKLLILAPVVLLVAFLLYFLLSYTFEPELNIKSLKLTNVTDTSVTVSWVTDKPTTGYVVMADNNNFDVFRNIKRIKFGDDREMSKDRYTHHVTVSGLTPESTYYFNVVGSLKSATYTYPVVTTAKTLDALKTPDISYAELATDSDDYIVYAELPGSQMVSVPLAANNTFTLDKALIRTSALDTFVTYKDKDIVSGEVVGGTNSSTYLYQVGSDAPAKINLDFKAKVSLNRSLVGSVSANSLCDKWGLNTIFPYNDGNCPSGQVATFLCTSSDALVAKGCAPDKDAPAPAPSGAPTGGVSVAPTPSATAPASGECAKAKADGLAGLPVSDQAIINCKGSGVFGTCNSGRMYVSGGEFNGFWIECPTSVAPGLAPSNNAANPTLTSTQCDTLYSDGMAGKSLDDGQIKSCAAANGGTLGTCNNRRQYVSGGKFNGFWVSCSATDPAAVACRDNQTGKTGVWYAVIAAGVNTPVCLSEEICNAKNNAGNGYEVYNASCRLKASAVPGTACNGSDGLTGMWSTTNVCTTAKTCATDVGLTVRVPAISGCVNAVGPADGTTCYYNGNAGATLPGKSKAGKCIADSGTTCSAIDDSYVVDLATLTCSVKSAGTVCHKTVKGKSITGKATADGCKSDLICNAETPNTYLDGTGTCVAIVAIKNAGCTTAQGNTGHYYALQDKDGNQTFATCLDELACVLAGSSNKWMGNACVYDNSTTNAIGKPCLLSGNVPGTTPVRVETEQSVTYSNTAAGGAIQCRSTVSFCAKLGQDNDVLGNKCVNKAVVGLTVTPSCTVTIGTPPAKVEGKVYPSAKAATFPNNCASDAICVVANGIGSVFDGDNGCSTPAQSIKVGALCGIPGEEGKYYETGNGKPAPDNLKCNSPIMCGKANSGSSPSEWEVTSVGECRRKASPSGRLSSNLTNVVDAQASVLGVADASGVTTVKVSENGIYKVEGTGVTTKEIKVTTVKDGVAEIKFFNDVNANGVQDTGEELITEPVSVKLEKTSDVVKYDLTVGWNLVAFNFVQSSFKKANELVNEITSQGGVAITVATYRNGKWLSFIQRSGIVLGDNFDIVPGEGYFIRVTKATTLDVGGTLVQENSNVYLSTGWNLLGLRTSADKKASDVLDALNKNTGVNADIVTRYVASKYENVVKDGTTLFGEDFKMESNRGYFIRAKSGGKVVSL